MPPPRKLREHLARPGTFLSEADRDFVRDVQIYGELGVGFGFMQQVIEWTWQEWAERKGLPGSAWGPEYFQTRIAELERENAALKRRLGDG